MNAFDESVTSEQLAQHIVNLLSERELECFVLMSQGRATKQICVDLNIGYKTAATYRHRLRQKLGVKTAEEVAVLGWRTRMYLKEGLVLRQGPLRAPPRHTKRCASVVDNVNN